MNNRVTINVLEIQNVKKVKAVKLHCVGRSLVVIGGGNGEGKTSILDGIAYALGGERYRPSNVKRDESMTPPEMHIELSNGLIVERKGKNSALKVTDPQGGKGGQKLLDAFIGEFALNLPKFLSATPKEKLDILLNVIGVGDQLAILEREIKELYDNRHTAGQIADQKKKYANEMLHHPEVPATPISVSELIQQQQGILARNGENQAKRGEATKLERDAENFASELERNKERLDDLRKHTELAEIAYKQSLDTLAQAGTDFAIAQKTAEQLQDESTAEIETSLRNIEDTNIKVRANLDKEKAIEDSAAHSKRYDKLTGDLERKRQDKLDLLNGADLPLPGLSVEDGELTLHGKKWDCQSGAEQLCVATSIVRKLNPNCGVVLIDKLEQLDVDTLSNFRTWLETEGLQVIGTRVSTGEENSLIIEDGVGNLEPASTFTKGTF